MTLSQDGSKVDADLDLQGLAERYRRERAKRLRPEGYDQYIPTTDAFQDKLTDPHADPAFTREPLVASKEVVIVGGGFAGLMIGAKLKDIGIDEMLIFEKGADFGGTWYWNRYPGIACDVESYIYMPLLEEVGYIPTEKYASGQEIYQYVKKLAEKFDLVRHGVFQTVVTELRWNEDRRRWRVETDRGDVIDAKFVITAGGALHKPKLPAVPGLETFKGHWFHTSRWDYDYTGDDLARLADKRVGLIGTGSTAIQCIPPLAGSSERLFVFQRTPASVDARGNRPTDPEWAASLEPGWQQRRMDNFNSIIFGGKPEEDLVADGWTDIVSKLSLYGGYEDDPEKEEDLRQLADFRKMEEVRRRIDSIVVKSETADLLKPYYNQFCKRPCFHDEYLSVFNRENVTLVDTNGKGVDRITGDGIAVSDIHYPLDCIIFSTGFEFEISSDYSRRLGLQIYGRDGVTLSEKWRDGALTFHGLFTHGFPNYFICSILQSAVSPNLTHVLAKQAEHIAYVIDFCREHAVAKVEAAQEAEEAWVEEIISSGAARRKFLDECTPGYMNNDGKKSLASLRNAFYGKGAVAFFDLLAEWRERGTLEGLDLSDAGGSPVVPQGRP